ncbi:hypothetical protein HY636_01135 [Candidatus Woesearchaeota archaeon]|nr:hypothetical protein [Candidatus Woesearchaeota archaeon]
MNRFFMNLFSEKWHIRPYTSNHVKLVLNFQIDARALFEKETSPDLGQWGYAGYLRGDMITCGITCSCTIEYMRRRFSEFPEVTEVCNGIEAKFKEYDSNTWNAGLHSFIGILASVKEGRNRLEYLESYLPLYDILEILDKPYLNRILIAEKRS